MSEKHRRFEAIRYTRTSDLDLSNVALSLGSAWGSGLGMQHWRSLHWATRMLRDEDPRPDGAVIRRRGRELCGIRGRSDMQPAGPAGPWPRVVLGHSADSQQQVAWSVRGHDSAGQVFWRRARLRGAFRFGRH